MTALAALSRGGWWPAETETRATWVISGSACSQRESRRDDRPLGDELHVERDEAGAPNAKRITMAGIAAAADVSIPTVSKVLNGRTDVAPETRARVESLLSDLRYSRNPRRRVHRAGLIDLVFVELSPWATEIIRGAEEAFPDPTFLNPSIEQRLQTVMVGLNYRFR